MTKNKWLIYSLLVFGLIKCSEKKETKTDQHSEKNQDTVIVSSEMRSGISIEKKDGLTFQYLILPNGDTAHVLIQNDKGEVIKNEGGYSYQYFSQSNNSEGQVLTVIYQSVSIDTLDKGLALLEYENLDDQDPEWVYGLRVKGIQDTLKFNFKNYKPERILALQLSFFNKKGNQDTPVETILFKPDVFRWPPADVLNIDYERYKEKKGATP